MQWQIFIGLTLQSLDKCLLQCGLALVLRLHPLLGLVVGYDGRLTVFDDYFVGGHGDDGVDGVDGDCGVDGMDGDDGDDEVDGVDGDDGVDGENFPPLAPLAPCPP